MQFIDCREWLIWTHAIIRQCSATCIQGLVTIDDVNVFESWDYHAQLNAVLIASTAWFYSDTVRSRKQVPKNCAINSNHKSWVALQINVNDQIRVKETNYNNLNVQEYQLPPQLWWVVGWYTLSPSTSVSGKKRLYLCILCTLYGVFLYFYEAIQMCVLGACLYRKNIVFQEICSLKVSFYLFVISAKCNV